MSKSDLHGEEVTLSSSRILDDSQTDILVAESLVFRCVGTVFEVIIIIGIIWVRPRFYLPVYRIIILNIVRAVVFTIPIVILVCRVARGGFPFRCIDQLGRSTAGVDQEKHDRGQCESLILGGKYRSVPSPVVSEEEDEIVGS